MPCRFSEAKDALYGCGSRDSARARRGSLATLGAQDRCLKYEMRSEHVQMRFSETKNAGLSDTSRCASGFGDVQPGRWLSCTSLELAQFTS